MYRYLLTATPGLGPSNSKYRRPPWVVNPRLSDGTSPIDAAAASATKHEPRPQTAHPRSSPHTPKHSRKPHVDRSPQRRLRAVARSALGALGARRRLIRAEIDAAPPTPGIEADDGENELGGSSPTRALALRRSPPPPARSRHSSRRRARLSSRAAATACEFRRSHAGLQSQSRALEPPAGDGSRRSAASTSRYDGD
jgi:hypothetical protein